jgi:hypothetical protein
MVTRMRVSLATAQAVFALVGVLFVSVLRKIKKSDQAPKTGCDDDLRTLVQNHDELISSRPAESHSHDGEAWNVREKWTSSRATSAFRSRLARRGEDHVSAAKRRRIRFSPCNRLRSSRYAVGNARRGLPSVRRAAPQKAFSGQTARTFSTVGNAETRANVVILTRASLSPTRKSSNHAQHAHSRSSQEGVRRRRQGPIAPASSKGRARSLSLARAFGVEEVVGQMKRVVVAHWDRCAGIFFSSFFSRRKISRRRRLERGMA